MHLLPHQAVLYPLLHALIGTCSNAGAAGPVPIAGGNLSHSNLLNEWWPPEAPAR